MLTGLLLVHAFSVDHVTPQWLKQKFQHKTTTAVLVRRETQSTQTDRQTDRPPHSLCLSLCVHMCVCVCSFFQVALLLFTPMATHQYVMALHCRSYASVYGPPVAHNGGAGDAAKGVFDEPARLVYDPDTFCYGGEQTVSHTWTVA